ncbi:MAG: response regulator transcription factor [Spirochaetia bacterium]|nr:response regulator transcription factor [Spirochaetia bacterium]
MSVCIVDDDPLVAEALKTIISADKRFEVSSTENSGEALLVSYARMKPDIILMDIRMKGISGIETGKKILSMDRSAGILFLTTFSDDEYIIEALKMGAGGYLLKQNYDSIVPSLLAVYAGQRVFGDAVAEKLSGMMLQDTKKSSQDFGLSDREFLILEKVADGLSNREISEVVFLGEGTVRNYVSTILDKLGLRDRTQLAVFYYRNFV